MDSRLRGNDGMGCGDDGCAKVFVRGEGRRGVSGTLSSFPWKRESRGDGWRGRLAWGRWIPAYAGMTGWDAGMTEGGHAVEGGRLAWDAVDSRLRGNDGLG